MLGSCCVCYQTQDFKEAWKMGEREDFTVMVVTFITTVTMGVIQGIGLGAQPVT